jgi:hypothetical protein
LREESLLVFGIESGGILRFAQNDNQIIFSEASLEFTANGSPQSNNIRTFVRVNVRSEEKNKKIRTLHESVKGCGTQNSTHPKA